MFGAANAWVKMERTFPSSSTVLIHPAPIEASDAEFQKQVNAFALMALFSKVVYRQDIPEAQRIGAGCKYLHGSIDTFGMPKQTDHGWQRLVTAEADAVKPCFDEQGLYYETYLHTPASGPVDSVVIAIRGTENYLFAEQMRDWSANFAAAMGSDPVQYRLAREAIAPLIKHLVAKYPDSKIYVTGHSLGGGIAQQIAYTSTAITAAYVFDSSPVTNWFQMNQMNPKPIAQKNPIIHRINHVNEFLEAPRLIATRMTTTRLNRADYDFAFQDMGKVSAHEMGILACHLAVRMTPEGAEFDFPANYVKTMLQSPAICPLGKEKVNLPAELVAAKMALP